MAANDYLEILAGQVFDHDKLVTYKWLSKELEVHVNIAKQMLWEFYEKYRDRDNIECTYLLIGMLKENGMRVEVVKESDLSKAKEKFSKIISEHMYSVHKPLEDLELLANSDTAGDVRFSAIKCDACVERSDEEMNLLRWGTAAMKITEGTKVVNSKPVELVNRSKIDKEPAAAKKNGFNNFFNTAGKQKSPETSKASKTEKDESEDKNNSLSNDTDLTERGKGSKKNKSPLEKSKGTTGSSKSKKTSSKAEETNKTKKGGLESFFGKMSSLPKPAEVKAPEKKEEEVKVSEKKEEEVKVSKKEEEVKVSKKKEEEIFETKKVKEKEKPRGKKRIRSQGSDRDAKKRKRIVVQTDSSDSEAQSDMDVEEPMPEAVAETEAPIRPKSPSPPAVKHENGKRKMLKMVNETYKDDRGFIVTKKVHVYVSCSEDEEEKEKEEKEREQKKKEEKEKEEKKKKEKGPSSKKQMKVDNAKKKQSVLTSFFSKAS
ncbi:DNA polymerase delta subunit 3 [Odontomachus brunneus]|uniref:DNA polymerase delta subunit 3 n=1 Tax=Odontomachus brunneus TaxID=486640 RepID=UPI0013F22B28|nr:DNA polymerase delta subunit 3 [Odontomachus brunneus]